MKYIVLMFLTLFTMLEADEIAVVKSLKGEVLAKSKNEVVKLKVGALLDSDTILISKENSLAVIIFKDNSILHLGQNSIIHLKKFIFDTQANEFDFKLFLQKGSLIFESGQISKFAPEDFELKTPEGMVAIRGTKFGVHVE